MQAGYCDKTVQRLCWVNLGKLPHENEVTLHTGERRLFWPFAEHAGLRAALLALLLPTRDHNLTVLAAVDGLDAMTDARRNIVVPLFLADPFLHLEKTAATLKARGLTQLMALPSVGQWGPGFGATLDALNLGAAREIRQITILRDLGLEPLQTICTADPLSDILVSRVVVVPTLLDAEYPDLVSAKAASILAANPGLGIDLLRAGPALVPFNPRAGHRQAGTSGSG